MISVAITGVGLISSIGCSWTAVEQSLRNLRAGLRPWRPLPDMDLPVKLAGTLEGFDVSALESGAWSWPEWVKIDSSLLRALPPHGVYALAAVQQALAQSGLNCEELSGGDCGLFCASIGSPRLLKARLSAMEKSGWHRGHPLGVISSVAGTLNFNLGSFLGIRGASCGFVSACASASHALGYATDEIRLGRQRRMIVVGAEDLSVESLLPFHAMGALSTLADPTAAARPFDVSRNGFVGTGGAAVLILEEESLARSRGVRPLAKVSGWGQSSDGFNAAAPHPEGEGLSRAMQLALQDAGLPLEAVDCINAHGTGTFAGDRAEALAIRRLYPRSTPAVASTKSLTGHALSMAGALEAAISVIALHGGFTPGQAHLQTPLPEGEGIHFPKRTCDVPPAVVLNQNCGFGGANVCHVLTHA